MLTSFREEPTVFNHFLLIFVPRINYKLKRDMKKITNLFLMALLALSMGLVSCDEDFDNPIDDVNTSDKDPNFKSIIVLSDIHVMAPQLL